MPTPLRFFSRFSLTLALLCLLAACTEAPRHEPLPPEATVVVFGDSITHGTGTGKDPAFPELLAQATGWQVVNAGKPGDTARAARSRLPDLLSRHQPELVIVELGGNDFLRQRADSEVKADLRAILTTIRRADAVPLLLGIPELSLLRAGMGRLRDAPLYSELGEEEAVTVLEGLVAQILSREALRADRIHPNGEGHRRLSRDILSGLRDAGLFAPARER